MTITQITNSETAVRQPVLAETVIEPQPGWRLINGRELWRYRELLAVLAWRDVKVRYKQTVLGAAWAVLQPLAMMAPFVLFVGPRLNATPGDVPYALFVFAGLLAWFFFANMITSAAQSVVGSQSLVTKIYFPRLLIPWASAGPHLLDLAIGLLLLLVMMPFFGVLPGPGLLLAPVWAAGLAVAALGVGTMLAALTVAYRDFRYVVPFMTQFWLFATPSIYMRAGDAVGPKAAALLPLNPAYGLIAAFRASVLGEPLDGYAVAVSSAVALAGLLVGCFYFRRVERGFADVI